MTYLALDPLTPVVRYLEGPAGPILPAGSEPPLLLLAAAAPRDLPDPGAGALDALADALAPDVAAGRVRIERVDHLSARRLEAALLDRQPALFHFHGHSFWSSYDGAGGLALEGQDGRAELLDGATLATLLGAGCGWPCSTPVRAPAPASIVGRGWHRGWCARACPPSSPTRARCRTTWHVPSPGVSMPRWSRMAPSTAP